MAESYTANENHKALARYIKKEHGAGVKPDTIALVLGASRDYRNSPERRAALDARKAAAAEKKAAAVERARLAYERAKARAGLVKDALAEPEDDGDDFEEAEVDPTEAAKPAPRKRAVKKAAAKKPEPEPEDDAEDEDAITEPVVMESDDGFKDDDDESDDGFADDDDDDWDDDEDAEDF